MTSVSGTASGPNKDNALSRHRPRHRATKPPPPAVLERWPGIAMAIREIADGWRGEISAGSAGVGGRGGRGGRGGGGGGRGACWRSDKALPACGREWMQPVCV